MESLNLPTVFPIDSSSQGAIRRPPSGVALERHHPVGELAKLWELSERTIWRIFSKEPGGLRLNAQRDQVEAWIFNSPRAGKRHPASFTGGFRVLREAELREQAVVGLSRSTGMAPRRSNEIEDAPPPWHQE
jgi:hypothetical protein